MTNYEVRAMKFARVLARLFTAWDCVELEDFISALDAYNDCHTRKISYDHGVSRVAVIRADYVIKFDYKSNDPVWAMGRAGSNDTESSFYDFACAEGFGYLFAKSTPVEMDGWKFSIMPRIDHVGDDERWYEDYLTPAERLWLNYNVNDLHEGNLGYKKGKPVIIDYAWNSEM